MGKLKSAYDIALARADPLPPGEARDGVRQTKAVDGIVYDVDKVEPSPLQKEGFFVDDLPNHVRGSRAMSPKERLEEKNSTIDEMYEHKLEVEGDTETMVLKEPVAEEEWEEEWDDSLGEGLAIHYEGPMLSFSGFSQMNRNTIEALTKSGVDVTPDITETSIDVSKSVAKHFKDMSKKRSAKAAPKIYGMTMPALMGNDGPRILYTMIESSSEVHSTYAEKLNLFDEIWVPSHYLKEVLSNSGVVSPIEVMPLGVDAERYLNATPLSLPSSIKSFKFLSLFGWSFRKGYDLLLKAYLEEFSSEDDVSLVICSKIYGDPAKSDMILGEINDIKAIIRAKKKDLPQVIFYGDNISDSSMPRLYKACDAFVLMSRGEGFGLPYIEAAAAGLPVIGTNCTAQSDYLNAENSFLVEPEGYEKSTMTNHNTANMAKICHFYEDQYFPKFGEKSISVARDHMREIYETDVSKKTARLQQDVLENLTWKKSAERIIARLRLWKENDEHIDKL